MAKYRLHLQRSNMVWQSAEVEVEIPSEDDVNDWLYYHEDSLDIDWGLDIVEHGLSTITDVDLLTEEVSE